MAYRPDIAEWGVDVSTPAGARIALAWSRHRPVREITDGRDYTRAVRAIARTAGREDLAATDGRLLAVGLDWTRPSVWVREGHADAWLAWWRRAADRPDTVDSSYNPDPGQAYAWYRAGVDAQFARAVGRRGVRVGRLPGPAARRAITHALERRSIDERGGADGLTLGALRALGRLSPEGQRVALSVLGTHATAATIDWARVGAAIRRARLDTPAGRAVWGGRKAREKVPRGDPAYPRAHPRARLAIARGVAPRDLLPGLTAREAHEALAAGWAGDAAGWLLAGVDAGARDIEVARWVVACLRDPQRWAAVTRRREQVIAGRVIAGTLLERLDEVLAIDLGNEGTRASVERVLRRAGERMARRAEALAEDCHTVLQAWPGAPLPAGAVHLATPAALVAEGREMAHCVGSYGPLVADGLALIVAIRDEHGRSTARWERQGRGWALAEHRGAGNGPPPREHAAIVAAIATQ